MNLKKALVALTLILTAGFASANNHYTDAGVIPAAPGTPYAAQFDHVIGAFTDTLDFTVPEGSLGSSANPLYSTLFGVKISNITNLQYSLFSAKASEGGVFIGQYLGNDTSYDTMLAAGNYHFFFTGVADGVKGGSYAVGMISGVPEPETYAMMFAGLALLGVTAYKKRKDSRA